jgi:prolyl-tRNA editing enzyme YbaK/EbsC (Cys-tRNA(Pro) deacylase)
MSKSLKRVQKTLEDAGVAAEIVEVGEARTAAQAALAATCALDQIVKSIIFLGTTSEQVHLFLTAGGNQVCVTKASAIAGEPLGRADADLVRRATGFAIGGVAPIGHLSPIATWIDPRLFAFETVWAAAGTPRHIFNIDPRVLISLSNATIADFIK